MKPFMVPIALLEIFNYLFLLRILVVDSAFLGVGELVVPRPALCLVRPSRPIF
jgi:hypothetical protein